MTAASAVIEWRGREAGRPCQPDQPGHRHRSDHRRPTPHNNATEQGGRAAMSNETGCADESGRTATLRRCLRRELRRPSWGRGGDARAVARVGGAQPQPARPGLEGACRPVGSGTNPPFTFWVADFGTGLRAHREKRVVPRSFEQRAPRSSPRGRGVRRPRPSGRCGQAARGGRGAVCVVLPWEDAGVPGSPA